MKRSIFISRELAADSELLNYLLLNDWNVEQRSLITIETIPFQIDRDYDWIFISSSNGARIFFESYSPNDETKIGVVGEATAKAVKQFGYFPDFIGNSGNMNELGDRLARTIGTASVLFVGAEGGSEKIRSAIPRSQMSFIPIYRSIIIETKIPETDYVFLTSPSNARAYLKTGKLNGKKVIAIGQTTSEYLKIQGLKNILVPTTPKESDLIELLRKL